MVSLQYTLDGTQTGGTNAYAEASSIEQEGISWSVEGNTMISPWRIGGKSLSSVNRTIYSKTAISSNISKIELSHGAASSVTVNSVTVTVHSTAADAVAGTNAIASFTPTFAANSTMTIEKADETSWANCFYRIVYNLTISSTSNKYLVFNSAQFYGL